MRRALLFLMVLLLGAPIARSQSEWDTHNAAGLSAYRAGNIELAESAFKKALKAAETSKDEALIGMTCVNLSAVKKARGMEREVEPLLKRAVTSLEKAGEPAAPHLALALESLGLLYYDQVLASRGKTRNDVRTQYSPGIFQIFTSSGEAAYGQGGRGAGPTASGTLARAHQDAEKNDPTLVKLNQAEQALQRVVDIRAKFDPEGPSLLSPLKNLGELYIVGNKTGQAETTLRRALAISERADESEKMASGEILTMIASTYRNKKQYADAEPLFRRALALQEGSDSAELAITLQSYALLLKETERKDEAKKMESRAKQINKKLNVR